MSDEIAIKVEHVSKKYCKSLKRSMLYGVKDIARNTLGMSSHSEALRKNEFWAIDDISFELKKGETLGIIGPNGAGKTTLLKMLNGIFWPDKGKITIEGRVGALIAVGAGFHPLLNGRENIYINAAVLGMEKAEVDKKFDEIVAFADIGDFLDTPVKFYSSGMFVRLGFAIAVHCEPDILLVDEVLAVGDVSFRAKCYNRIAKLMENCAVVFVSHDMRSIARISSECMVIHHGQTTFLGKVGNAIQNYYSLFPHNASIVQSENIQLVDLEIDTLQENEYFLVNTADSLTVNFTIDSGYLIPNAIIMLQFQAYSGEVVGEWNSRLLGSKIDIKKGRQRFQVTIPSLKLNVGVYDMTLLVTSENRLEHLLWIRQAWHFKILGNPIGAGYYQIEGSIKTIPF